MLHRDGLKERILELLDLEDTSPEKLAPSRLRESRGVFLVSARVPGIIQSFIMLWFPSLHIASSISLNDRS
ncbi:MAG: hypothetical protein DMG71_18400 [Acidobacteria bacterium]|nr:MAG: hypothetical protein DMG71_18400 [Acidobacteriota bacterium]